MFKPPIVGVSAEDRRRRAPIGLPAGQPPGL